MRSVRRRFLSCVSLWVLGSTSSQSAAFLQPEGRGVVILTTTFSDASKTYDAFGTLVPGPSYRKFETRAYVEYGAFERLTLVAETSYLNFHGDQPFQQLEDLSILVEEARAGAPLFLPSRASGTRYAGVGSGWVGARVGLVDLGWLVVSLQASLRAATPAATRFLDMKGRLQEDARLQLGWPIEIFGIEGFADAQIGYRSQGQNGGEIRADVTCGLRPIEHLLLLAQSYSAVAPGDWRSTYMSSQKFQLSAVYDVTPEISLQVGILASAYGLNDSAERGVVTAMWYRF